MTASSPPGKTQRKPCRAFGLAQYRMPNMMLTMITSTGHLAMSHVVTAAEPMPSPFPARRARLPVTTTISTDATSSTSMASVIPSRMGYAFQAGRPSGTS